jgi:hypothetical protein
MDIFSPVLPKIRIGMPFLPEMVLEEEQLVNMLPADIAATAVEEALIKCLREI